MNEATMAYKAIKKLFSMLENPDIRKKIVKEVWDSLPILLWMKNIYIYTINVAKIQETCFRLFLKAQDLKSYLLIYNKNHITDIYREHLQDYQMVVIIYLVTF